MARLHEVTVVMRVITNRFSGRSKPGSKKSYRMKQNFLKSGPECRISCSWLKRKKVRANRYDRMLKFCRKEAI